MNFFEWYGTGIVIIIALFSWQAYKDNDTIAKAADEVYDIFIRKASVISSSILLIVTLLGPLLLPVIVYFIFHAWRDGLAVDEDDNKDYPWSDE
jgi:hypothetical protein